MTRPDYDGSIKFGEMSYFNDPSYNSDMGFEDEEIIGSMGSIYLTGGGFIRREFKGIGTDSQFGWEEMVWYKTPSRTQDFSFRGMDDTKVGLVARCEITIPYNNIQDFMDLRKIVARERHFLVTFFNVDTGKWVTRDMYCTESSRNKLFTLKQSLIGAFNISVKLVGTNLDLVRTTDKDGNLDKVAPKKITYNLNGGTGTTPPAQTDIYRGTQVTLAGTNGITAPSGKHFVCWSTMDGQGVTGSYTAGQATTIWEDLNLFAQWEN